MNRNHVIMFPAGVQEDRECWVPHSAWLWCFCQGPLCKGIISCFWISVWGEL